MDMSKTQKKKQARVKVMRKQILSSAVKLENKDESYYIKEDLVDFPKKTKGDSEDSEPPSNKRTKRSISPVTEKNQWFVKPSQRKFMPLNSPNFTAKGKGAAEIISSPLEAWSLLFSDDILNIILKCTNQEMEQYRSKHVCLLSNYNMLDMLELKAFIGLLYYAGWTQKRKVPVHKNFSIHSLPLFKETTSQSRIKFLRQCLSFDDKTTRKERFKNDCFAHISEIWSLFITNCIQYYEPGYNVTIDEQILNFEKKRYTGYTGVHLSTKRGKLNFGLKFVTMNDSETFYMINAIPYLSNVEIKPLGKFPYKLIKISEPIHNTRRNITCGSWFTSMQVVDIMREAYALTMIGSLPRSDPDVPPLFKSALAKETCQFAYYNNKTLVSYKPDNDKMILLLSSLHSEGEINKVEDKPEIVLHYNKTMEASDIFDQLCHKYTVSRNTIEWSIRIFYGMLDQAAVNSFVLYTLNANNQIITRDTFLLELSMTLIKPYLIKLLSRPNLHIFDQCRLKYFFDEYNFPENDPRSLRLNISNASKVSDCYLCPTLKRISSRNKCLNCNNYMCMKHEASICKNCAKDQFS